jgi:hypothetical protein
MTVQFILSSDLAFQDPKEAIKALRRELTTNPQVYDNLKAAVTGYIDNNGNAKLPSDGVLLMMGDTGWLQRGMDQAINDGIRAIGFENDDYLGVWYVRKKISIGHTVTVIGIATEDYWGVPYSDPLTPWRKLDQGVSTARGTQELKDTIVPRGKGVDPWRL